MYVEKNSSGRFNIIDIPPETFQIFLKAIAKNKKLETFKNLSINEIHRPKPNLRPNQ